MTVERIADATQVEFPKLGWVFHINPTAFKIGNIEIQWYGILITLGLLLAFLYCFPKMKRFGIDSNKAIDAVLGGIIGGIIGARIYYVVFNWSEYKGDFKEIINIRNGGLAIYGGIIGALAVGLIICRIRKIKMLPMLDIASIGFLIGQGIGRWGNFVNQEAYGSNTNFFLGMTGGRIQQQITQNSLYLDGDMYQKGIELDPLKMVHPCFLYESLWCLLGFVILAWFSKRRKYDGQIFLIYLTWYGLERFFVEQLRTDSLMIGELKVSQILSGVIVVAAVIIQIVIMSRYRRDRESFVLYVNTEEARTMISKTQQKNIGIPLDDIDDGNEDSFSGILDDEDENEEEIENNDDKISKEDK